jgi:protoheme IX farnesyltransferase
MGYAGAVYGVTALVAGIVLLALSLRVWREGAGEGGPKAARQLFAFSILYLFVLFAVLLIEAGFRMGA